jgi:hypothetical protein
VLRVVAVTCLQQDAKHPKKTLNPYSSVLSHVQSHTLLSKDCNFNCGPGLVKARRTRSVSRDLFGITLYQ